MNRKEMLNLLFGNFCMMNPEASKEVKKAEVKKLISFSDLKLRNMVSINCM